MLNSSTKQPPSAMQLFKGRIPSVPVRVAISGSHQFDTKVPDFSDVASTEFELYDIIGRWLWFMHWDDFWAGSHAMLNAGLVGACCPVEPGQSIQLWGQP